MGRAKKEPGRCKATTKKSGRRCTRPALDDGYCAHPAHRPKPGGAPAGNRNGWRHGGYSKGAKADELEMAAELDLLSVDDELLSVKLRFIRTLQVVRLLEGKELSPSEEVERERLIRLYERRTTQNDDGLTTDEIKRLPDFERLLDRWAGRIESLVAMKMRISEYDELRRQLEELSAEVEAYRAAEADPGTE